jgi:hypothetical protein
MELCPVHFASWVSQLKEIFNKDLTAWKDEESLTIPVSSIP